MDFVSCGNGFLKVNVLCELLSPSRMISTSQEELRLYFGQTLILSVLDKAFKEEL